MKKPAVRTRLRTCFHWGSDTTKVPLTIRSTNRGAHIHLRKLSVCQIDGGGEITLLICTEGWADANPMDLNWLKPQLARFEKKFGLRRLDDHKKIVWRFKRPSNVPFVEWGYQIARRLIDLLGIIDKTWICRVNVETKLYLQNRNVWVEAEEMLRLKSFLSFEHPFKG